jgi:hypothetical protein
VTLRNDEPPVIDVAAAIHAGDLTTLERLLAEYEDLANAQIQGRGVGYRTPLHVVSDWTRSADM